MLALSMFASACAPSAVRPGPRGDAVDIADLQRYAAETCCRQRPRCDPPPRPFTTDACSMWPDGDWGDCCVEHDIAYWCGGPDDARESADDVLRACVGMGRSEWFSTLTYIGVRAGGAGWTPFPWRWGYGWDWLGDPE